MTNKQRSLLGGISILGIAGLICKVVGVLYKIPLANMIGSAGIGAYQKVFPTYNLMLTVSSAGIPVAISRMVAHNLARGRSGNANKVLRVSMVILSALGLLTTLLMLLFSGPLAVATGTPESKLGFMMIAPSLLLVCVMSAYRGYMQGHRRMVPTAVSQLIEQVGKVGVALPLAHAFMLRGGYALGAAGALLGTSLAEAVALLYMMIDYRVVHPRIQGAINAAEEPLDNTRRIARELVYSAIPITIGACIVPLAGAVDSFMLDRLMQAYLPRAEALSRYGIYSGLVIALINVPTALAMAMSANLVPSISQKRASGDKQGIKRDAGTGLRLSMVVGLPSSIGMSLLSEPIMFLLFGRSAEFSQAQLRLGGQLLAISSLTIVVFTIVQSTSGILQGLYKQRIPMYTLLVGVGLKIMFNYAAVRVPAINIFGAPWASLICYVVSAGLNTYYVVRYAGLRLNLKELLLAPGLATLAMAMPVLLFTRLFGTRLNHSWGLTGLCILLAVVTFVLAAFRFGAVKRSDLPARFRKGH